VKATVARREMREKAPEAYSFIKKKTLHRILTSEVSFFTIKSDMSPILKFYL
jgi:hypothetical protein